MHKYHDGNTSTDGTGAKDANEHRTTEASTQTTYASTSTPTPAPAKPAVQYSVKQHSLQSFLYSRHEPQPVSLERILALLNESIKAGKLYDENNKAIVLCDQQLENVFGMKALHVAQIIPALKTSLVPVNIVHAPKPSPVFKDRTCGTKVIPVSSCKLNQPVYTMSLPLYNLLLPTGTDPSQPFTYKDAAALFSRYIISRKEHIFDTRNIFVALIMKDPLGKVFGVKAFHRDQAEYFIRKHLKQVSQGVQTDQGEPSTTSEAKAQKTSTTAATTSNNILGKRLRCRDSTTSRAAKEIKRNQTHSVLVV